MPELTSAPMLLALVALLSYLLGLIPFGLVIKMCIRDRSYAKADAIAMHPGPMNRGVEIDGDLADDINRSVIQEQVEMGVAVRMACMDLLARNLRTERGRAAVGVMV